MSDLVKRLRIKAGMIEMGEMIAWGSDSALMREAANALEMAAPAVQVEPTGQKPAPDVSALVAALTAALEHWRHAAPKCWYRPKPHWITDAESALAAHRKQGGDQ